MTTRHTRANWRGIGWWLAAALVAVVLAFALGPVEGVIGGLVVLLVGVALA